MARRNLILSITLLAIGVILLAMIPFHTVTRAGRPGYFITISPRTFPFMMTLIMTAMGLFNVAIAARSYMKSFQTSLGEAGKEGMSAFDLKSIMPLFGMMFAYVIALPYLGYIVSTIVLCIGVSVYFKARFWQAVLLGCLLSPIIYVVFTRVGVPLPRGILYFL